MNPLHRFVSQTKKVFREKTYKNAFNVLFCTDSYSRQHSQYLYELYDNDSPKLPLTGKRVIYMFDGRNDHNIGLADRLRGAAFIYNIVKEMREAGDDIDFSINFTHPFQLSQYLVPNEDICDWRIEADNISNNLSQVEPIQTINKTKPGRLGYWRYREYLKRKIRKSHCNQFHVYSNTIDKKSSAYSTAFHELFRPSERLQEALNPHLQALDSKEPYLNITLRFQNLLGDFYEGDHYKSLDDETQKQDLIARCMTQIENIHDENPDKMILVTSDSRSFLNVANKKKYVYTIDGELVHMAHTTESSFETHQKAFVDYLMIAGAEKIYCLRTGKMYNSGFPRTAAMINNRPFERVQF